MPYSKVKFEVIKDIYWDNWGKSVKVFSKGQVCEGQRYPDGSIVAESPYYPGVSDLVDSTCLKQVFFTEANVPGGKGHE